MEELIEKAKKGDKQAFTRTNTRNTKWIIQNCKNKTIQWRWYKWSSTRNNDRNI